MMLAQTTHPSATGYTPPTPQMPPTAQPQQFAIETRGVTKRHGRQTVVSQLNLAIPSGGICGFLGPNGAGKSTTMKMLLGLTKPTEDGIRVFGQDLRTNRADVPPRIGSLIKGPAFYPHLTGAQNLRIAADYLSCDKGSVDAVLDIVGLTDAAGRRAHRYSLGVKQCPGVAMALISGPELLLLDEPTNGLDPAGVAEIRNLVVWLTHDRGITIMVSSHLLSKIEQMTDVVDIVQSGYPRYQGPLSSLRDQGQLVMKVSPVNAAMAHLEALDLRPQGAGDEIVLPPLHDGLIVEAVARLVGTGVRIAWVELRHKSLEEAFLKFTEIPVVMPTAPQVTGGRGQA